MVVVAAQARKKVAEALREVIRKRKEEKKAKAEVEEVVEGEWRKKDMLDELLAMEEEEEEEGGEWMTEEEMVDYMVSLLVAGYETTSTIMTLAVKYLTDNPEALAHLTVSHE